MAPLNCLQNIEKLMGVEDYPDWKLAIKAVLQHEKVWGCVEGNASAITNEDKMTEAMTLLTLSIHKNNYSHIREAETPKQLWDNLASAFDDKGLTRKIGILRTLVSTRLENCSNVEDYVNKIFNAAQKLNSLNF